MSKEKVVRYDMQYRPDWAYNQASMMPSAEGRYIEYADVAGLVEALRSLINHARGMEILLKVNETETTQVAKNALARFQQ